MNFTHFFSKKELAHVSELKKYCAMRISQIQAVIPAIKFFESAPFSASYRAQRHTDLLRAIVEELESDNSNDVKLGNIQHLAKLLYPLGYDIVEILQTGRSVLPQRLGEIKQFLEDTRRSELQAIAARQAEQNRLEQAAREAEKQLEKRQKLAEELGIAPEQLEKLAQK